jgi:RNase P subunit RPR2
MIEHCHTLLSMPENSITTYKTRKTRSDKDAVSVFVSCKNCYCSQFYLIGGGVTKNQV